MWWASGQRRRFGAVTIAVGIALSGFGVLLVWAPGFAVASPNGCAAVVTHENGANDAIQLAINANPGKVICVRAGVFPEQVTISAPGTVLRGAGASRTILEPTAPLQFNTVDYDSASSIGNLSSTTPTAAIVLVANTTGALIEDVGVNGTAGTATFTSCAQDYDGVDFQNSSGSLVSSSVTGVELPGNLFGCQPGLGIYAYDGYFFTGQVPSPARQVTVRETTVTQYDKNGITCDDPGLTCTLASDLVTGLGPNASVAQNGIQIGFGALGQLLSDRVSANVYDGPLATNDWYASGATSAGILFYDAASGTTVTNGRLVRNQIGIASYDDGVAANGYAGPQSLTILGTSIVSSSAYGIVLNGAPGGADSAVVHGTSINNLHGPDPSVWGAPAILVDTGHFSIYGNVFGGSSRAAGASNGASQIVCGTEANGSVGEPILSCPTNTSVATATIEGVSEAPGNPTVISVYNNVYISDPNRLSTLSVLGGTVTYTL